MPRLLLLWLLFVTPALAADPSPVADFLKRPVFAPDEVTLEVRDHVRARAPRLHPPGSAKSAIKTAADWEREAERIRQKVLKVAVFRGEAAKWRDAKSHVEWLESITEDGYRIKKLRY